MWFSKLSHLRSWSREMFQQLGFRNSKHPGLKRIDVWKGKTSRSDLKWAETGWTRQKMTRIRHKISWKICFLSNKWAKQAKTDSKCPEPESDKNWAETVSCFPPASWDRRGGQRSAHIHSHTKHGFLTVHQLPITVRPKVSFLHSLCVFSSLTSLQPV